MASFDLLRITESLQSPKTKPRNDALALLDGLAVSKLRLSSSQLASLVSSLFKSIEIERDVCVKTPTNAAFSRATNASGILKDLMSEAVKKPSSSKERPKLKMCLSLINNIASVYYMSSSLASPKFPPCSSNLAQTLAVLLETPYIFTHITIDAWLKAYHFLIRAIAYEFEYLGPRGINENLVSDLYSALFSLVGGTSVRSMVPLLNENTYFPLARLLTKTLAYFKKRESPVLVTAFKILNHLLISLSTEDAGFSHQLIRAGINCALQFAATSVASLSEQIFIFLNLDSMHRYLSLSRLPKLVSVQPLDNTSDTYSEEETSITTYNLEMLIYALLNRLISPASSLTSDDIGICEETNVLDWYHLSSIYLQSTNSIQWLLASAISKLVDSYYTISKIPPQKISTSSLPVAVPQNGVEESLAVRAFSTNSFKRQKLHDKQMNLNRAQNPAQFYTSLVNADDERSQKCGLQLLAFHYELHEPRSSMINRDVVALNESKTTDQGRCSQTKLPLHTISVLSTIVKLTADRKHSFWALLVCRIMLPKFNFDVEVASEAHLLKRRMYQMLKLSLDLIKDKSLTSLACSIFGFIVQSQTLSGLKLLVDNTLMNQLDNVTELSELLGPASIDTYAFVFWQALTKIYTVFGSTKRTQLPTDVGKWLIEKWTGASEKMQTNELKVAALTIAQIIEWLGGVADENVTFITSPHRSSELIYKDMKDCEKLQKFIVLENEYQQKTTEPIAEVPRLEYSPHVIDSIVSFICRDLGISPTEERLYYALSLSMAFLKISEGIRKHFPEKSVVIEDKVRNLLSSLTPFIRQKDQAEIVLSLLLEFEPQEDILHEVAFPFEIMDYHSRFLHDTPRPESDFGTDFESEFSSDNDKQLTPGVELTSNNIREQITYFKFLAKYDSSKPDSCINFLKSLPPCYILECISFYMDINRSHYIQMNPLVISGIVRLIGEKLLSVQDFDRLDSTISISCRFLTTLIPSMKSLDKELQKDILDLFSFFFQCVEKDLSMSESARTNVWKLMIHFTENNDEMTISNSDILSVFLNHLPKFSNRMKIAVSEDLHGYISRLDSVRQELFSDKIAECFSTPQSSVEGCATFCLFLTTITSSLSLDVRILLGMTKYSRFTFFIPYLKQCVLIMAKKQGFDHLVTYFRSLKLDLLRHWWLDGLTFFDFPWQVFGYFSIGDFAVENSMEIMAVLFAMKCKADKMTIRQEFVNTITKIKDIDSKSLVRDSLPLIIALSYTPNGIRSEVFISLKNMLGALYNEYLVEALPLIVLEVIKLTNVKSEIALKAAVKETSSDHFLQSSELIRNINQETIDPSSSVELVWALIKKFRPENSEDFWSLQIVYFLVRNVGLECSSAGIEKQKNVLRKLQFVLCLSRTRLRDFHLVRLFVKICLPMLRNGLTSEVYSILSSMDFESCLLVPSNESLKMVFEILATILSIGQDQSQNFEGVCESLERLLGSGGNYFGTSKVIIECALNYVRGQNFMISLAELETFLEDEKNNSLVTQSSTEIFTIISILLNNIRIGPEEATKKGLAAMCLKHRFDTKLDERFRVWLAEYLAEFHLSGSAYDNLEHMMSFKEYDGLNKMDFIASHKSLDPLLIQLEQNVHRATYEEAAFLENAIGVLIYKFETRKRDVMKFLDFDDCHEYYCSHILPLGVHSYSFLNPEFNECFDFDTSMDQFVSEFEQTMSKLNFQDWSCELLLSLTYEVSRYTSVAPVLASCILKMPSMVKDVLPSLICLYLSISGERGIGNVSSIFNVYWKNFRKPFNQESIELIKNIAISLRVGAMQNIDTFKQIYGVLDHKQLFFIVRESYSPKSALMFFEDAIAGKIESLNWKGYREPLAKLYGSLNDEDSLLGIPGDITLKSFLELRHDFVPSAEKLRYSSGFLDADFILNNSPSPKNVIQSLSDEGFLGASNLLNKQSGINSVSEWSWKLNQWDLPIDNTSSDGQDVTYAYFKQIRDNPVEMIDIYKSSMLRLVQGMPCSIESNTFPRDALTETEKWLASLARIKSANSVFTSSPTGFASEIALFEEKTRWFEATESQCFEDILLARRLAFVFHSCGSVKAENHTSLLEVSSELENYCRQGEVNEIVRYTDLLRKDEMLQKTISSTILLERLVNDLDSDGTAIQRELQMISSFQTAQTLWAEGKMDASVALLRGLARKGDISHLISSLNISGMAINAQLAMWLSESRSDLGANILREVVDPMKSQIDQVKDNRQRCQIYHLLAQFCESQFKSHILKEQLMQLEVRVKAKKDEVQEIKSHYGKSEVSVSERNAARYYYEELKSSIKSETKELGTLRELRTNFAHNAVKFYLNALLTGEASDEDLDKFFSLFLELSGDEILQSSIKSELLRLPSHKPLSWCTQILSRVSKEVSNFQESIQRLIYKICFDHPFHSLYYLTSLLFHEKLAKETSNAPMISRVVAATHIRNKLQGSSPVYAKSFLLPVERLCIECVSLAEVKSTKGRALHLDKLKIGSFWLNELPQIPPLTLGIPVSFTGYKNAPVMMKIDPRISIASSGISLPKVVSVFLSNGTRHKMLLKHGADDLRQDAIMEQVFDKVNKIFHEDKETRKRKLRVRTYSAVPLGPKAGAIEFVPDSKAFFEVISPYHKAMDSMNLDKARELMKNCQTKEFKERLKVYQSIKQSIKPVLEYYFLSNFVTPDDWFASRQIYIRGVATTSIVGHVLGLGDRHCNNILLDEFTGEPIHIDLGVAFDQGKRLKIPETVPFRLTRDIVDGFGYMGTAGSFTKVSEHTFRVLRASKEHILAILDVLRWDPLYSWSISPIRKKKLQEENTEILDPEAKQDGSAAAKAILGVSDKLGAGGLSVEAAVRELIREAASDQNLAVIYCGWCPFY